MTIAKNVVKNFDGDFLNTVLSHEAVGIGSGFAIFSDGSAVEGSDYSIKEVDVSVAQNALDQQ